MKVMRDLVGVCLSERYRVIKRLAGGGMGEVYRGHDLLLDRPVAVKVLQSNLAADPEHLERFKAEARSAARFSHPCVVAVYDWGSEDDSTYYMVMEYVSGSDLRDLLVRRAEIEQGVVLEIMAEVCDALEAAHSVGLVHRDIKPENILIARDGKVKVADFGIAIVADANRASSRTILGTLRYLSPEQAQGKEATRHSDIWAAGAVLSELLTGHAPPHGSGAEALQLRARQTPTRPSDLDPTIPPEIDDIVMRACALEPEDRFANAEEMGDAIRAVNVEAWGRKAPVVGAMFEEVTGEVRGVDMEPTSYDPSSKKARVRRHEKKQARRRSLVLWSMLAILIAFGGRARDRSDHRAGSRRHSFARGNVTNPGGGDARRTRPRARGSATRAVAHHRSGRRDQPTPRWGNPARGIHRERGPLVRTAKGERPRPRRDDQVTTGGTSQGERPEAWRDLERVLARAQGRCRVAEPGGQQSPMGEHRFGRFQQGPAIARGSSGRRAQVRGRRPKLSSRPGSWP